METPQLPLCESAGNSFAKSANPAVHRTLRDENAQRPVTSTLGFAKKMVATPQQRLPLWRAFSEFFLDTELDAVSFEYVAREIRASGLSLAEAESVLWNEVFPVLAQNLLDLAGVWAGWPDDWLLKHVRVENHEAPRKTGDRSVVSEISRCWDVAQSVYQSAQT